MKIKKLIEQLKNLPENTDVYFYLIPNNGKEEDSDQFDIELSFIDSISSNTDTAHDNPYIDFGFQVDKKTDISHFQDLLR